MDPLSQRRDVVARIQDVSNPALPFSFPDTIRVWWEGYLTSLSAKLHHYSTDCQHPPYCQDDEIICLEGHIGVSLAEIIIQNPPE